MKQVKLMLMVIISIFCLQNFVYAKVNLSVNPDDILCDNFLGFGAHGDCMLGCEVNTGRGVTEADRKKVFQKILSMRPHIIRTFFAYQWWEPEEGRQTPDSEYVKDYVEYVGFLKSIDCQVNFCPWGDCFAYSNWMGPKKSSRMPANDKKSAMIRSYVDFIEYLRRDKGLTNVSYVTLMNEPANDGARKPTLKEFVELNKMLDMELKKRGLRDKLFMVGIDGCGMSATGQGDWFYDILKEGGTGYFDGAASHTYFQSWDCPTLNTWVQSRVDTLAEYDKPSKPFMINEFGSFGPRGGTFTMTDNDKYGYGLFLAKFAVTALKHKTASVLVWCLFDTYYDSLNKQEAGLLYWKDRNWEPKPGFYSWSLLTRLTRPGSKVINVSIEPNSTDAAISAVALISPQNKTTFLMVNSQNSPVTVKLNTNINEKLTLDYFEYSQQTVPTEDTGVIKASKSFEVETDGMIELVLPAESFVVLSNVEEKISQWTKDILSLETGREMYGFHLPDRTMIIAPEAYTAYQVQRLIKKERPDFWVLTFDPAYDNPIPLPNNFTLKAMIGAWTRAFAIEPEKGCPAELTTGFEFKKVGSIYQFMPK